MSEIVGAVYLTAARDRAVFLAGGDLDILRDLLDMLQARPTAAGPPLDVEAVARLSRAVDLDEDDDRLMPEIVLSDGEQQCLELLCDQLVIREKLPLRIRQACTACGDERITNPARQAEKPDAARLKVSGQSLLNSAKLLSDGHPFLAALSFLVDLDSTDSPTPDQKSVCTRCDGDEFTTVPVTFCPGCRAVRDESVLIRCPECDFDFNSRGTADPLWTSLPVAVQQHNLARNQATLRAWIGKFENGIWPGQSKALMDAVGPDDRLLAMCRCGLPGEVGRYVALLITTEQLVWAWKSPISDLKSGTAYWRDVRQVREQGNKNARPNWGVRIEVASGKPVVLTDFRGTGLSAGEPPLVFTADTILRLMTGLHQQSTDRALLAAPVLPLPGMPQAHPTQAVATCPAVPSPVITNPPPPPGGGSPPPPPQPRAGTPPQLPPPPGQSGEPPPPGWYADPWRAARLRWWTGSRWTGYLSR
jgi:hypothetical protein